MATLVVLDLDNPDDVLRAWAEAARILEHRKIDPELREAIIRVAIGLDEQTCDEILAELDRAVPAVVLEANFAALVPNRPAIGACRGGAP